MTADQETDIISTFISSAKSELSSFIAISSFKDVPKLVDIELSSTTSVNVSASNISFRKGKDRLKQLAAKPTFDFLKSPPYEDARSWLNNTGSNLTGKIKTLLSLLWLIQNKPDVPIVSYQASKSGIGGDKTKGKLANATPLFEQVAAAAFRLAGNGVVSLPDDNTELINLIRGVMADGYGNTDNGGTKFTDDNWKYYTEQTGQVRKAAQGSLNFINQYGLKPGNMEIIWSDIKPYYAKMRSYKKYAVPNKKENTADMAILFGGLDIGTLFGEDYHIPNETEDGYLEVKNSDGSHAGWLLQVSLKIGKEEAQVGKSGKDYQPYSSVIDTETGKKVTRKGITLRQFQRDLKLHHDPLDEGFFGDLVKSAYGFVKHSLATLKKYLNWTISKLSNLHKKLLGKLSTRNVIKQSSSLLKTYARRLNLKEEFLVEKKMKDEDIVDAIMAHPNGARMVTEAANQALAGLKMTLRSLVPENEWGAGKLKINIIDDLNVNPRGLVAEDIRYLLCNKIAFETLDEFYQSVVRENVPDPDGNTKDILSAIADYTVDMGITTLMGESLLPVLKLYGESAVGVHNWEVLQRSDMKYTTAKAQAESKAIDIGGIDIGRSMQSKTKKQGMGYYTVQQITLAKYENDKPTYNKVQLRTGGKTGGFAFFIEANKQVNEVKFS